MPNFNIIKKINYEHSFRNQNIIDNFDLDDVKFEEEFKGNTNIENKDWNIGLIIGGSGTGKTTITEYYVKKNWTVFITTSNKGLVYSLKKNKHWKYNDTHLNTIVLRERPELSKYNISTEDKKIKSKNIETNIDNVFTREISSFKTNKEIFYNELK